MSSTGAAVAARWGGLCNVFRTRGHVAAGAGLSDDACGQLREVLTELLASQEPQGPTYERLCFGGDSHNKDRLTVLINAGDVRPMIRDAIFRSSPVLEAARELLGSRELTLIADEVLIKPAREGAEVTWHQDWVVNPHLKNDYLTCWMPLDDVLEVERGPMEFFDGSHLRGRYLPAEFAEAPVPDPRLLALEAQGMRTLPRPRGDETDAARRSIAYLAAGEMSFHHSLVWHRSYPNRTAQPRFALAQRFGIPE
jgi:ectoine hydroxylase-related dioxygenase (phytanoyl-CoA dioxygenase family)